MGLHNPLAIPRFPMIVIPWSADTRKGGLPVVLLVAVALLPAAYSAYVLRQAARRTTAATSISPPDPLLGKAALLSSSWDGGNPERHVHAIPPRVLAAPAQFVVATERVVSEAVPLWRILPGLRAPLQEVGQTGADGTGASRRRLLDVYLAATMRAFTWTPQALAMKFLVSRLPGGPALVETFSAPYLDACRFEAGDRVCGVYVVRERVGGGGDGERVFLDLSAPEGWKGPVVEGVLDCGFVCGRECGEGVVRFVNETVLWRTNDGKPTLLEGTVSRWLHTAMVRWMMVRGVEAVTGSDGRTEVK